MLTALHIQNFILIDELSMTLRPGLTALTGETGAGKSILLDALSFAAGGRAGRGGVRPGAEKGAVTAVFEPAATHPAWAQLEECGYARNDDQIILRRVQHVDGKSRAFVNGEPAAVAVLRQIGGALLEIHGQHDGRGFLNAATHRSLLDAYGGLEAHVAALRKAHAERRDAFAALDSRRDQSEKDLREAEYLRFVVDELRKLAPEVGEEARLAARRTELSAAEKVTEDLAAVQAALGDDGLERRLAQCVRRLSRAVSEGAAADVLAGVIESIDAALTALGDARGVVETASERFLYDQGEADRVEERLFAIRAAARKHGVAADKLAQLATEAEEALQRSTEGEADAVALKKAAKERDRQYRAQAADMTSARRAAAAALVVAVAKELEPLKLGAATFEVDVRTDDASPGPEGVDVVEFLVATNPDTALGPLKTVASGGELSRFVLAMKAALAQMESRTVIIFDEVDSGVGGAVADAVGERLSKLAAGAQVLVVTHSPQVAARADAHCLVSKSAEAGVTRAKVVPLDAAARVEEVARMLSGAHVTNEARAAAAALLGAPRRKPRRRKSA